MLLSLIHIFHPTVSVLQVSKLALAGHFHVQFKVLFHFGDIAHKDLAAVLFYADYRLFQLQLVVEMCIRDSCKLLPGWVRYGIIDGSYKIQDVIMIFSIRDLSFEFGSVLLECWLALAARAGCALLILLAAWLVRGRWLDKGALA